MAALLGGKLRSLEGNGIVFYCPGCETTHVVYIGNDKWVWNGDSDRVTIRPSVLSRSGHFIPGHRVGSECWCTYDRAHPEAKNRFKCVHCHLYITDGMIEYLADCSHALKGQKIALPVWTSDEVDKQEME